VSIAKIQAQGVHHITFVGSNREATIDFYEGVLGMPLVMEQPNLDVPDETHLYFDAGDGRLITFFVRPTRVNDPAPNPEGIGNLHHLAYTVSRATYTQVARRLNERGIWNTGNIDRGFMDSIYFRDHNGQLLEMACYKFVPPEGYSVVDVLVTAHRLRVVAGAYAIEDAHLADAIVELTRRKANSITEVVPA
jgi:catechol 2,3-dioxygenase-like lactoylglutathione lyase family enzyme